MKHWIILLLALLCLTTTAEAASIPEDLERALPEDAEIVLDEDWSDPDSFHSSIWGILQSVGNRITGIFRHRLRGAVQVLLAVLLCGTVDGICATSGGKSAAFLPMAGAVSITALSAGSVESLLGLGSSTIHQLAGFSEVLLPALAAASAAAGGVTSATMRQLLTLLFIELLVQLIDHLLVPLVLLYIAMLTAGACLRDNRLEGLAEGLKKITSWLLCTVLLVFTGYLSVTKLVGGSADVMAVKLTKAAVSGAVPVVGSIIAEATESVLVGAGLLRNTIGFFGMAAVFAACVYPFLQLGIQYILYKLVSFLSSVMGLPGLYKLINGLGGAFGLMLAMTGSCALLLLLSILSFVSVVVP